MATKIGGKNLTAKIGGKNLAAKKFGGKGFTTLGTAQREKLRKKIFLG